MKPTAPPPSASAKFELLRYLAQWLLIATLLGIAAGLAVAFFLWALDECTLLRFQHPWLIYLMPLAGAVVTLAYLRISPEAERGNNLLLDEIHEPAAGVPLWMAPLVLLGTLATHLVGGSAGREGTAVQMGGSMAYSLGKVMGLSAADRRMLLMAGMAAGFGAVFGTPVAGAIFAIEVLAHGQLSYRGLLPALVASLVGDYTTTACGIGHTDYIVAPWHTTASAHPLPFDLLLLAKVAIAAVAFGLIALLFAEMAHRISALLKRFVTRPVLRPVVGALVVLLLTAIVGSRDYLGLGVMADPNDPSQITLATCFEEGGADRMSWAWKTIFTTVTVGSGFKGGEVTPLFFIGAAAGNTLAELFRGPVGLLAAVGFVSVFAGATKTPLASTIMGLELFGGSGELMAAGLPIYLAVGCYVAVLVSGHQSIYRSQRIGVPHLASNDHLAGKTVASLEHRDPTPGHHTTSGETKRH